ncbi:transposase [Alienimonas chondri]|uniref:Transposase IS200-like domain-containing protein n=1 Tax=Alienimonas chondri TaxID=2681879 RepID=A0ABX1VJ84_9PLAN|nr:transposase [Alienimonas chondri]NNJ27338.1 hypothetical protein [Alienimonas chondri]
MREEPCRLTASQRQAVEAIVQRHCEIRGWTLHAVNVRTNHVHVVLTATDVHPKKARTELKSWATRVLKQLDGAGRLKWWSDGGSARYINDQSGLEETIDYVRNRQ